jgi:hypothetical protein
MVPRHDGTFLRYDRTIKTAPEIAAERVPDMRSVSAAHWTIVAFIHQETQTDAVRIDDGLVSAADEARHADR